MFTSRAEITEVVVPDFIREQQNYIIYDHPVTPILHVNKYTVICENDQNACVLTDFNNDYND
jgi:hypothetical protein